MRGILVAAAVSLGLVACSGPSSNVVYASHGYSCCIELTGNTTWHPGQQLTLHWTPQPPAMTTDATPHQIVLDTSCGGRPGSGAAAAAGGTIAPGSREMRT